MDTNTCHYCGIKIWWDDQTLFNEVIGWVGTWKTVEDNSTLCLLAPFTGVVQVHLPLDA